MSKTYRNLSTLLLVLLMAVAPFSISTAAETTEESTQSNTTESTETVTQGASSEDSDYYIKPNLPDNQRADSTYFDLRVSPGQEQELTMDIVNKSDEDLVIMMKTISASTTRQGIIDYSTPNIKDETLMYPFSDISEVMTPELTVGANQTAQAKVKVTLPEEEYDGIILGSIYFIKKPDDEDMPNEQDGFEITNLFSYSVGVVLSENDTPVNPDFEYFDIQPELVDNIPSVVHYIRNTQPAIATTMDINVDIYRQNNNELVLENSSDVRMAPNSVMHYPTAFTSNELEAGKYISIISLRQGEQVWDFQREFEITARQAREINESSPMNQNAKNGIPAWGIALIVLGVVLVILIGILIYYMNRRNKIRT